MSRDAPTRLVIELDVEAEPITGQLSGPAGKALPFTGWLELMAAIEEVRGAELHAASTRARPAAANRMPAPSGAEADER
jgi:hypothetical protein